MKAIHLATSGKLKLTDLTDPPVSVGTCWYVSGVLYSISSPMGNRHQLG